jgi:hypothetical protein
MPRSHCLANRVNAPEALPAVEGQLSFLAPVDGPVEVRVYPPSSGLATVRPASVRHAVPIRDARPIADRLRLDEHGFELHSRPTAFAGFYDEAAVRDRYYPEVESVLQAITDALAVIAFDHNVRSVARAAAARSACGCRSTRRTTTTRKRPARSASAEILEAAGRRPADRHVAFVNLWRPIVGPVLDNPLTVCDARSVSPEDLVATEIHHFGEDDLTVPRHSGQIQSVRYNPEHRWLYVSEMRPDEFLLLMCYDSRADGRARFMPHTGFVNPARPSEFVPRESIETRTLVVFDERA